MSLEFETFLNEQINIIKKVIDEKEKEISIIEKLKNCLLGVINKKISFKELNLQELIKYVLIDDKMLKKLNFFQLLDSSSNLEMHLTNIQLENEIIPLLNEYTNILNQKINEYRNNLGLIDKKNEFQILDSIRSKISREERLSQLEYLKLCSLIKDNLGLEGLNYIKELSLYNINLYTINNHLEENEEEVEVVEISNLQENKLIELFKKYNLNFDDFEDEKEKIRLYGKLDQIEEILKILADNHIKLDIKNYKSKISQVLLLSNASNVRIIIENIKKDLHEYSSDDYKVTEMFLVYLNSPSIFRSTEKTYQIRNNPKSSGGTSHILPAAFKNYVLNRNLFIELGIDDINAAIKRCMSVFTESNKKVKANIKAYSSYGIDINIIFDTLSSLVATNPLDVIDQFIEADCYPYIISCFSSTTRFPLFSKELYQIINAKRSHWGIDEIYRFTSIGDIKQMQRRESKLKIKDGTTLENTKEYNKEKNVNPKLEELLDDTVEINKDIFDTFFIRTMEQNFKHDDLTYNINGIIISRNKVLRIYSNLLKNNLGGLESLKYAIFRNTIMSEEEHESILNVLNQIFVYHKKNYSNLEKKYADLDFSHSLLINSVLDNFFIALLEENYKENEMFYNFEGIMIPRYDVIKNFCVLLRANRLMPDPIESLIYAIIRDKNLSNEECYLIARCITSKFREKRGKKND